MTRQEQIAAALALLAPPAEERDVCARQIPLMLDHVDRRCRDVSAARLFVSKQGKAQMRRYRDALKKVRDTYSTLDPAIRPWFSLAETAFIVGEPMALDRIIDRELKKVDLLLERPSPDPKPDAVRAKAAVAAAHQMLTRWGHKPSVTRGGTWVKLAQVFAGDGISRIAIFEHVRNFKKRGAARITLPPFSV